MRIKVLESDLSYHKTNGILKSIRTIAFDTHYGFLVQTFP